MKKSILISSIFGAIFMVGCGSSTTETTTTAAIPATTTQTSTTCNASGNTVLVPEGTQCTYSIAVLNGGTPQTYSCTNGKVKSNGISGTSITFNETTIICE